MLRRALPQALVTGLLVFLPALLIAAPWFWRNWTLHGDPLGMAFARQTVDVRTGPWTAGDTAWLLRGWFISFWGKFGGAGHIPMAGWLYGLLAALSALAGELGIRERVRFVPAVPAAEVPAYLRAMDALVLPSRTTPVWKEQFGHVLIEAMACEVPAIGSDSGAIPEVIGPAGLLFPEGDASALARALDELRSQPALRKRLGEEGRRRVLERYTHEQIARQTADIYRRALTGRRTSL